MSDEVMNFDEMVVFLAKKVCLKPKSVARSINKCLGKVLDIEWSSYVFTKIDSQNGKFDLLVVHGGKKAKIRIQGQKNKKHPHQYQSIKVTEKPLS